MPDLVCSLSGLSRMSDITQNENKHLSASFSFLIPTRCSSEWKHLEFKMWCFCHLFSTSEEKKRNLNLNQKTLVRLWTGEYCLSSWIHITQGKEQNNKVIVVKWHFFFSIILKSSVVHNGVMPTMSSFPNNTANKRWNFERD